MSLEELQPNAPLTIALESTERRIVEGYLEYRVLYRLAQPPNTYMYADPSLARKIDELAPRPNEAIQICRRRTGRKSEAPQWEVQRHGGAGAQPRGKQACP